MEKKVADLRSHEACQARLGLTEEAVKSYEKAYKAGKELPALEVFDVDGEMIVVDGFHRLEAAKRADVATLPVELVGRGTMAEAEWTALGKNHNHGVRRTREDKRKAVQMALGNEAAAKMSNRKLAQYLDVSHTFVANERRPAELRSRARTTGGGCTVEAELKLARHILSMDVGKELVTSCEKNVRLNEKLSTWIENPNADPDIEPTLTMGPSSQWIRLTIVLNHWRGRLEQDGNLVWVDYNMTHVAALIAEAAGCRDEGVMKLFYTKGFSRDHDLIYDDVGPRTWTKQDGSKRTADWGDDPALDESRRLNEEVSIFELRQIAPHRHVLRKSEAGESGYQFRSNGDPAPVDIEGCEVAS